MSRIYKTADGGASWTLQLANTDPKVFLDAMAFWSPDRGIAYSDSIDGQFVIFRTTDGRTWNRIPAEALPPALPNEGAYAASGTNVAIHGKNDVWIATTASRVLHSSDGGTTWTIAQTPIATSAAAGIFSVAFRSPQHGIAVGGDYQKEQEAVDNAAVTADGGKTWTLSKGLTGYRSVVAHVPRSKSSWLAVGPTGADITHDDGRTWTPVRGAGFDAFSFAPSGKVGWGAGARDRSGGWMGCPSKHADQTDYTDKDTRFSQRWRRATKIHREDRRSSCRTSLRAVSRVAPPAISMLSARRLSKTSPLRPQRLLEHNRSLAPLVAFASRSRSYRALKAGPALLWWRGRRPLL